MCNIFDYILWRGDLLFEKDPINCVDALIFSRVAYFPFDGLWQNAENGKITLQEANNRFLKREKQPDHTLPLLQSADRKLLQALAGSQRFQNIRLREYRNSFNPVLEKQFSAVTLQYGKINFIAFRGTDNTLVGWKEDFNMSFSSPVPSQKEAVNYLETLARQTVGPLYIGGHSKGGNLAVYAALFCQPAVRRRMIAVYNNDGPGFSSHVLSGSVYREMEARIHTFVPQSSVVGMLLEHEEDYTVVRSMQVGIMQHDLYSWEVQGPDFIHLKSTTDGSRFLDSTLKEWVAGMNREERSQFVDTVFSVLESTNADSFSEMRADWAKSAETMLQSLKDMGTENKKQLLLGAVQLLKAAQNNLSILLPKNEVKKQIK